MNKELDFHIEMKNGQETKWNFRNNKDIYIPTVYEEYSSKRVLTMEYIEGVKISD